MTRFIPLSHSANELEGHTCTHGDSCDTHWIHQQNEEEERVSTDSHCRRGHNMGFIQRRRRLLFVMFSLAMLIVIVATLTVLLVSIESAVSESSDFNSNGEVFVLNADGTAFQTCVGRECGQTASPKNDPWLDATPFPRKPCKAAECSHLSALLLETLDTSRNPCMDFTAFTCGRSADDHDDCSADTLFSHTGVCEDEIKVALKGVLVGKETDTLLPRATQNAITAYRSCTNPDINGTFPWLEFYGFVQEMGGWPMMDNKWNIRRYRWKTGLASAIRLAGLAPVIGFELVSDTSNPGQAAVMVSKPKKIRSVTADKMNWVLDAVANMSTVDPTVYARDKEEVIQLHSLIEQLSNNKSLQDTGEVQNISIDVLHAQAKVVPWLSFIRLITDDSLSETGSTFLSDDHVLVKDLGYLDSIGKHIVNGHEMKRVIANYIATLALLQSLHIMPNTTIPFEIENAASDKSKHWEVCLEAVYGALKSAVDWKYMMEKDKLHLLLVKTVTGHVLESLIAKLKQSQIMDQDQNFLSEQLGNLQEDFGENWLPDEFHLDKQYERLEEMGSDPVMNYWKLQKFHLHRAITQIRLKSPDYWLPGTVWPETVSPASLSSLITASSFLTGPRLYHPHLPGYINFGALGSLIGRKLVTTSVPLLRSNHSQEILSSRYTCMTNRLNKEEGTTPQQIPVDQLVEEATAVDLAYQAFHRWVKNRSSEEFFPDFEKYSPEQMFFLSYGAAQCHRWRAAGENDKDVRQVNVLRLRAWNDVVNTKHFLHAFNCPIDKAIAREETCTLF